MKVDAIAPGKGALGYGAVHLRIGRSGNPACSPRRFAHPVEMLVEHSDIECRKCQHILIDLLEKGH